MTARSSGPREPRRVPELRLPYLLLEYLLKLPGDYAKLALRLLQRAQWVQVVTQTGVALDAGEVLLSLRSRDLWDAIELDREVDEAGRVSLLRRVLGRLERDGVAAIRAAHDLDTPHGTRTGTRRDTPATVVRFLKFRDSLWPARGDAAHETAHGAARGATHQFDTILSREDPAVPAFQSDPVERRATAAREPGQSPRIGEVRAVLAVAASAFAEVVGRPYQHAHPQAVKADPRAAAGLLARPGVDLEAIETAWREALVRRELPRVETLADLAQHWGRLGPKPGAHTQASTRPAPSPVDAPSSCPEWTALARNLRQRLRPDLFEQWFAGLTAAVDGEALVLHATDDFHRAFLEDRYAAFITEELDRAVCAAGGSPRRLGLRITSMPRPCAAGAAQ